VDVAGTRSDMTRRFPLPISVSARMAAQKLSQISAIERMESEKLKTQSCAAAITKGMLILMTRS
jgi:hypothetical protein